MAYSVIQLNDMIDELGEGACKKILSQYSCPYNQDVEEFLTGRKAIDLARQGVTRTYLIFAPYKGEQKIAGYFSIAMKWFSLEPKRLSLSSAERKRITRHGQYDKLLRRYQITAPLIAQLGKNFSGGCAELITGDELLHLAIEKVGQAQAIVGGRVVYLECEPVPSLVDFYERNGFVQFGERELERADRALHKKSHLLQMLKYLG